MMRYALTALFALGLATASHAAGFDCERATTALEKRICASIELSRLDEELAVAYYVGLDQSQDPSALKREQARWLKARRNVCKQNDCLRAAYLSRLDELAGAPPSYANLAEAVTKTCPALATNLSLDPATCRSAESGVFGTIAAETFHYAVYCLGDFATKELQCFYTGIALFSVDRISHRATRWYWRSNETGDHYSKPEISDTAYGILLDMPARVDGTGNFNNSALFLRQGQRWAPIDTASWLQDLQRRLPKDRKVWKGIWPDLHDFTAVTPLYHEQDSNCCPSAGKATIALTLVGTRLAIKSVQLSDEDWGE